MTKSLIAVILIGAAIGLLVPTGEPAAPAAEANAGTAAAVSDKPVGNDDAAGADAPAANWRPPTETRLRRGASGHFYANANVDGHPVEFVVDTGATSIALTEADARRIGIAVDPSRYEVVGSGASGPVRGQVVQIDRVELDGKEVRSLRGVVLQGLETSLLGQAFLSQISGVTMTGDEMVLR